MSSQPYVKGNYPLHWSSNQQNPEYYSPAKKRAHHQVYLPYSSITLLAPTFYTHPESSSLTAENRAPRRAGKRLTNQRRHQVISTNILPDEVLLAIFGFCVKFRVDEDQFAKDGIKEWQSLVHVCRRWRRIVFGSPRGLNLRLVCTSRTPAGDTLDVWPTLPLLIRDHAPLTEGLDNIIAVLEHSNRVCQIDLHVLSGYFEKVSAAMQVPFPELTELGLLLSGKETVLPDLFLGGCAPRLQFLRLDRISFPTLPKLLLSAPHLVTLHLENIPHSGYISPKVMVTALSTLTSLEKICLGFQSPRSRPDWASRRPHPPTRTVLPALTRFEFKGVSEYLEDLVDRVDAPRLNNLYTTFFNALIFDTPHFIQFISRTPTLNLLEKARVVFGDDAAEINLSSRSSDFGELKVKISCSGLDWQVSSLEQICTSSLPPFSALEDLCIGGTPHWKGEIENTQWLELLRPYTAVKNFHLLKGFVGHIGPALKDLIGGRTTEVLPTLQNLFLYGSQPSGPAHKGIMQFISAREVTGHPITVERLVFQCPVPGCSSAFTRYFDLKEHLRSHKDDFYCYCKWPGSAKEFALLRNCLLREQLRSNHDLFICNGCEKPFAPLDAPDCYLRYDVDPAV